MKHFILTHFNVQLWEKDKTNQKTLTDEWLAKRFDLFETYCFPSVKAQKNPNFFWLCMFDVNTPERYRCL